MSESYNEYYTLNEEIEAVMSEHDITYESRAICKPEF